jgi:hypothetical protein
MARLWEIRGLFGNEYAMEQAVEDLKRCKGFELVVMDRRNLSVRMAERDEETESIVKRIFEIHHGYVESEAPLGEYDDLRQAKIQKKITETEKRRKTRG